MIFYITKLLFIFAHNVNGMGAPTYIDKFIFRMIHYSNLEFILQNGICSRNHHIADPNYINIGDANLIEQRNDYAVGINPPGGVLGDYIPFYFGGHSPMLLNIKTGYRGIAQRPQEDIIFIVCQIKDIIQQCLEWCFTDGHPKNHITEFFNSIEELGKVDWEMVRKQFWSNTEDDIDRMRRKQAEFLVKDYIPTSCIKGIIVYSQHRFEEVSQIIKNNGLDIAVYVDNNRKYFY